MRNLNPCGRLVLAAMIAIWIAPSAARPQTVSTSTEKDQKDLAVTVYNSNLALVRDQRRLRLPAGTVNLRFEDIAAQVNAATVHIVSLTAPRDLSVLEQNYEYDLLSPDKLLHKYVGRQLTLVRMETRDNSTVEVPVRATLLAYNDGPVWQIGDEIVTGLGADRYVFPDLPGNLYSKPTLVWMLDNSGPPEQTVEATYLTAGMNWSADYVFTIGASEKTAGLNGWVTLTNSSGTAFRNALLQLVAGEVHRVNPAGNGFAMEEMRAKAEAPAPQFAQQPISEYHLYTLQRRTTLADNETKQISLLGANGVKFDKVFELNGQPYYFRNRFEPGAPIKEPVEVHIKFKNSQANSLGMPLPAGTVRVYQNDSAGRAEFIGEDQIDHTPKDESLDLHIGNAFDVVADRQQTDYKSFGSRTFEMAYEISIRNHKPEPVTVEVNEPIGGDWTMLESNFTAEKTSAFSARFQVPVAANGQAVLKYRVRVRW